MSAFPLETIRHSAAHVLAQAVLQIFPEAKLGIGPAIEDGFYYDFDLPRPLTQEDLDDIERRMQAIIKEGQSFKQYDLAKPDAEEWVKTHHQEYKQILIDDLNLDHYSFFENGPFVDLCRGPHVGKTSDIGAVKLLKVSGAYWQGSEKNKMLQRIYGTAWHDKKALRTYLHRLEEAEKRDHRVLGKALDLFSIHEESGSGLVLWHPKGALIRHLIESQWKDAHFKAGYQLLYTPHVGRSDLWKTSGHLGFYEENMYASMDVEGRDYYIKPMNCPFHILVYQNTHRSYRELPLRYAELGTVYRYERSGVLHGLFRVRGFTQDDAHIICTPEQASSEIKATLKFCLDTLALFGFEDIHIMVSTRPEDKYVGALSDWASAEAALRDAVDDMKLSYDVDSGGGAFYGPKIDIKIRDAIGREWQCSTVQFDFNLPERFDMTYVAPDGEKHRPYMIHRALLGSLERFFGILIEHYEGKFPFWLAPEQLKVLSLNETVHGYCQDIADQLQAEGYRVATDFTAEKLGYKIRKGVMEKCPYMLIVGKKEVENGQVAVRSRDDGDLGTMSMPDLLLRLRKA